MHALVTCGAFTPDGEFLELPELDVERLQTVWQEAVFALYLAEEKIEPEVVESYYGWYSNKARGHATQGRRGGIAGRVVGRGGCGRSGPQPLKPDLGHAHLPACLPAGRSSGCTKSTR